MEPKSSDIVSDANSPSESTSLEPELSFYSPTAEENRRVVIVSLFYLAVALLIGVPVWLKTTATYQAPLPFWKINSLSSRPIDIRVRVNILSLVDVLGSGELDAIQHKLQHSDDPEVRCGMESRQSKRLQLGCTVHTQFVKQPGWLMKLASESTSVSTFMGRLEESLLSKSVDRLQLCAGHDVICDEDTSAYTFVLLPERVRSNWPEVSALPAIISSSPRRNLVFVFVKDTIRPDVDELSRQLGYLLNSVLLSVPQLSSDPSTRPNSSNEPNMRLPTTLAPLPASSVYDLTVTILTNPPTSTSSHSSVTTPDLADQLLTDPTTWLETHLGQAFSAWLPNVRFVFHSQRLHAVDIERAVRSRLNTNKTYRYYTRDDLSNLVNYLESYLGAPQTASARSKDLASTNPGLHLILLLQIASPSPDPCPLPIRFHLATAAAAADPTQPLTVTSAATVPQWGGLFSIDATRCSTDGAIAAHRIGQQMVASIHELLGLTELRPRVSFSAARRHSNDLAHWELDSWFLHRTVESLFALRATMIALVDLLSRFPNMVINDVVAAEVEQAVHVWSTVLDDWQSFNASVGFDAMFTKTQTALNSINSAFFDHTLLGRLYFQEDQKFGIYVPLFAPIGISLLATAKNVYRILWPSS